MNTCANAVIHTCAGANSCTHQGGCGYPNPADDGYPSVNRTAGGGGLSPCFITTFLPPTG